MSKIDLDLEKSKKEWEDLGKELEKVVNEAQVAEMKRKIQFLKSTFSVTMRQDQSSQVMSYNIVFGL